MSKNKVRHTPTPWVIKRGYVPQTKQVSLCIVKQEDKDKSLCKVVTTLTGEDTEIPEGMANAQRIVDCVNALEGIDNPAKFVKVAKDLIDAEDEGKMIVITGHNTGLAMVLKERMEQLTKHGFTLEHDLRYHNGELAQAAQFCLTLHNEDWPHDWQIKFRESIMDKKYGERIAIAGALLIAEADRLVGRRFGTERNVVKEPAPAIKEDILLTVPLRGQTVEFIRRVFDKDVSEIAIITNVNEDGSVALFLPESLKALPYASNVKHISERTGLDSCWQHIK